MIFLGSLHPYGSCSNALNWKLEMLLKIKHFGLISNFTIFSTMSAVFCSFSSINPTFLKTHSNYPSNFSIKPTFKAIHSKNNLSDQAFEDFSVLSSSDVPWKQVWSSMGLYLFSLHIPLSFGGLSVIAQVMDKSVLDPQTEAISILVIQTMELCGAITLLKYTAKPDYNITSFLQGKSLQERNWVQASAVGLGCLIVLVLLSSYLADMLIGPKDVNNPIVKEIISGGSISSTALFITYCFVTPFLEEIVYRGFLLSSLATRMKWQKAVVISSCVFSAAHLSGENCIQLFVIGCVLGCSYCWSGNLRSSFVLHSLYNAATLMVTLLS